MPWCLVVGGWLALAVVYCMPETVISELYVSTKQIHVVIIPFLRVKKMEH